jgi:hypothetical protein
MTDIGDVDAETPVTVAVFAETDSVVEVFGVRGVDGNDDVAGQVGTVDGAVGVVRFGGFSSLFAAAFGKFGRQVVLGDNGIEFGIVAARLADDLDDGAGGRLIAAGVADDFDDDFVVFDGSAGGCIFDRIGLKKPLPSGATNQVS